jgi:hypothetical protein
MEGLELSKFKIRGSIMQNCENRRIKTAIKPLQEFAVLLAIFSGGL